MRGRILFIDDEPEILKAVKFYLEDEDFEVYVAEEGNAALELAESVRPDLIILDVMMATDTEGIEVSRRIAESPDLRTLPVLLLTGIRKAKNLPFGLTPDENWLPVRTVLEKPVPPDVLLKEIQKLLP